MLIYKITNTVNGKVYIGKWMGNRVSDRWKQHVYAAKKGSSLYLSKAIRKYGDGAFTVDVIDTTTTPEQLSKLEIQYISEYKSNEPKFGYNLTSGGDGAGYGNRLWMLRGPATPEQREISRQVGLRNKGKKRSLECRTRISAYRKAHPFVSACNAYRETIVRMIGKGYTTQEIWESLVKDGFQKGVFALRTYVRKLRGETIQDRQNRDWNDYLKLPNLCKNCGAQIIPKRRRDLNTAKQRSYCSTRCANYVNNRKGTASAAV